MHFLVPALLAWFFFRPMWQRAWFLMVLTMLVDLDHLLSTPIFDPERCSIGFHPLHTLPAIIVYVVMLLLPYKLARILALGLLFHMFTDFIDCAWMLKNCPACCEKSAINWICSFL
jgi:hypothetical protein